MVNMQLEQLFGFPRRDEKIELQQHHCDLGLAIQLVTEEIVFKMAQEAKRLTGAEYLSDGGGGVALNCVSNGKLLRSGLFKDIFIQPAAGDAGGALGAALAAHYIYYKAERKTCMEMDYMQGAYLGPEFSNQDILLATKKYNAVSLKFDSFDLLASKVADLINGGKVIGWFQGKMEFGPRALGNRTILGDARNPEMQQK